MMIQGSTRGKGGGGGEEEGVLKKVGGGLFYGLHSIFRRFKTSRVRVKIMAD